MQLQSTRLAVASLVRMRRLVLAELAGQGVAEGNPQDSISHFSVELWDAFLKLERCASHLIASLTAGNRIQSLPAYIRDLLALRATQEASMVLRAEREARALGLVAAKAGEIVVVLKGGVPAVLSVTPALHLLDVDVLAADAVIPALDRALSSSGFERAENNEPHHTHWIAPPGRLPVEVHSTIHSGGSKLGKDIWLRIQPLPAAPGLSRLGWADQIVHLLQHSIEQHNDRHVRIRDILLIGWLDRQADETERARIKQELTELPNASTYAKLLEFARAIRDGNATADPFEDHAILHFAAAQLADRTGQGSAPSLTWSRAATVAAGSVSLFRMVEFASRNPITGKTRFSSMQKRWPVIGRAITRASRSGYYLLSVVIGVPALLSIRRSVRRDMRRDSARQQRPT